MRPNLPRQPLIFAPTPIVHSAALSKRHGINLWIKRDDATGGAEAGNKIRKLEFLLGDALKKRADTIVTCGGVQSNHARATAIACAQLNLRCVLLLRVPPDLAGDPFVPTPKGQLARTGNVLLDRLVGAEIRLISPGDYAEREHLLPAVARALEQVGHHPYVIPEGGSNGLGALGYVEAMREVRRQLDLGLAEGPERFDVLVHACGSGGTAAGACLGATRYDVATRVHAVIVCDSVKYFEERIQRIADEARAYDDSLGEIRNLFLDDSARGPGYGVMTPEQRAVVVDVARTTGIVTDPVYVGKALFALLAAVDRGNIPHGARVLFLHTGGLPGLLAEGDAFAEEL